MKIKLPLITSLLIVVFHTVGLAGFLIPATVELFLKLVPFHLLLMAVLLIIGQRDKPRQFWLFVIITYLLGFFIEMIGTNTGVIFGEYTYDTTLGVKLLGTPLLIGVNWIILVYSVGTTINIYTRFTNENNTNYTNSTNWGATVKSQVGAGIMVVLDILIEPVAVRFDYWNWKDGPIPLQNYVAWFIFSFILFRLFYYLDFEKRNPASPVMLVTQMLFFVVLNIAAT